MLRTTVLIAIAVMALPAAAEPQRVIVVDFEGGGPARELQEAVVRMLPREQFTVLEVRRADAGEVDAIAEKLDAGVRVTGKVAVDRRRHFILTVNLGADAVTFDLGRRFRLSNGAAAAVKKKLLSHFATLPKPADGAPMPPPQPVIAAAIPVEPEAAATKAGEAKPAAPAWQNFALVRNAFPRNSITLRGYYESRDLGAIEQAVLLRAPAEFSVFARTTLRSDSGVTSDLNTFAIDAFVFSPMLYSVGLVANVGSASGNDNDALRAGVAQTLAFKGGPLKASCVLVVAPFQTSGPGGRFVGQLVLTLGPLRSETLGVYGWPSLDKVSEPSVIVVRPDLRVRLWKSFGVYAQYDYNNTLPEKSGLRGGGELTGSF